MLKHHGKLSVYNVYVRRVEHGWLFNVCVNRSLTGDCAVVFCRKNNIDDKFLVHFCWKMQLNCLHTATKDTIYRQRGLEKRQVSIFWIWFTGMSFQSSTCLFLSSMFAGNMLFCALHQFVHFYDSRHCYDKQPAIETDIMCHMTAYSLSSSSVVWFYPDIIFFKFKLTYRL